MDHAQPVPAEPPAQFDIVAAEDEGGAEDMRADQQSAGPGNDGVVDIAVSIRSGCDRAQSKGTARSRKRSSQPSGTRMSSFATIIQQARDMTLETFGIIGDIRCRGGRG